MMDLQLVKTGAGKLVNMAVENSPHILTALGVAGVVTTTVMGIRATPRAIRILDEEAELRYKKWHDEATTDEDYPTEELELNTKDIIQLTWRVYLPTVIMGAATIGCIVGSNSIQTRRSAALAAAYSLTETTLREYQEKVVETLGEKSEARVREEIAKDHVKDKSASQSQIIVTTKGETLCQDILSDRWFKSDIDFLKRVQNEMNRRIISEGYITLNELYIEMHLQPIELGTNIGWHIEHQKLEFIFTPVINEENQACIVVSHMFTPRPL